MFSLACGLVDFNSWARPTLWVVQDSVSSTLIDTYADSSSCLCTSHLPPPLFTPCVLRSPFLQLGAEMFQQKLGKQCMQWLQVRADCLLVMWKLQLLLLWLPRINKDRRAARTACTGVVVAWRGV